MNVVSMEGTGQVLITPMNTNNVSRAAAARKYQLIKAMLNSSDTSVDDVDAKNIELLSNDTTTELILIYLLAASSAGYKDENAAKLMFANDMYKTASRLQILNQNKYYL